MNKKLIFLFIIISINTYSQKQDDWILGFGVNYIDFFPTNEPSELTGNESGLFNEITNSKDHWNIYVPMITVSRNLNDKFYLRASSSLNMINKIGDNDVNKLTYLSFDWSAHYTLFSINDKFNPYALVGGSYVWLDWLGSGTLNAGLGANYWFNDKVGISIEGIYKYSNPKYDQLLTHFQYSTNLIIKFGDRRRSNSAKCYSF